MVVRYDVGVAVLGLVDFQVRMLPGELLTGVNGLQGKRANTRRCEETYSVDTGERTLCNVDLLRK